MLLQVTAIRLGAIVEVKDETKTQKNRLFEVVHEIARDLHSLVFIDTRAIQNYDALCIEQFPYYDPKQIRKLREHYKITQAVPTAMLNTNLSAVQKWEIGDKHSGGQSSKLLSILDRKGIEAIVSTIARRTITR